MEGQLTIFDWQAMKEDIRRKLQETAENFVYIGYKLRQIEETESYKNDGASSIYEFAQNEYGLTRTVTQRFMAINAKFSVEGNSTELLAEYKNFGSSKLQEMLNLSDEDCALITEKTTVKEIRELKSFNRQQDQSEETEAQAEKEEQEERSYTNLQKCIIDFFSSKEKRETLNAVMKMALENEPAEEITRQQAELINPSEFASHTKGVVYLFMYEYDRGVAYKTIINNIITKMSWKEFVEEMVKIYGSSYGPDTWCNFYGPVVDTVDIKKEEKKPEKPKNTELEACATSHKKEEPEVEETDEEEETEEDAEEEEMGNETEQAETDTEHADNEQTGSCEPAPAEHDPSEGSIVENPYYKLQQEAVLAAETVAHLLKLHTHILIEDAEMKRIKDEIAKLSALTEQLEQLGKEQ